MATQASGDTTAATNEVPVVETKADVSSPAVETKADVSSPAVETKAEVSSPTVETKAEVSSSAAEAKATSTTKWSGAKRFEGKVALVTGSSEGIGYAIAYRIAQEGGHVIITSRSQAKVDKAVKAITDAGYKATGFAGDVTSAEDRKKVIEVALKVTSKIDVLVNNVAFLDFRSMPPAALIDTPDEHWDVTMNTNVKVGWQFVKETVKFIPEGGSIVFISSIGGYELISPMNLYGISKASVFALSIALAKELAPKGIRVNTVSPGPTRTQTLEAAIAVDKNLIPVLTAGVYQKRIGEPEEVASAAAFLASDEASYITGENIVVSGGFRTRI